MAAPVVTVIDCVAVVSDPAENVTVYAVPAVPPIPRFVKVATPLTAVAVVVPTRAPPVDIEAVTTVELSAVTIFALASLIEITGCVVNAAPAAVPTAAVVRTSCDATPTDPVAVKVTGEPASAPDVAVIVLEPAVPPRVHEPTVATPDEFVVTVRPVPEPPPVATANVTEVPDTTLPPESVTRTAGAIDTAEPAVADWALPALSAIVVAAPTDTVTDAVAVVSAPSE